MPELVSSFARNRQSYAGMYPGRPCVLGRRDSDSGRTKFELARQFGRTDYDFGRTKLKHWRPIGFKRFCLKFGE